MKSALLPAQSAKTIMPSYGSALLIYTGLCLALTSPFWMAGQVVAPDGYSVELGLTDTNGSPLENKKFADYGKAYIPEIGQLIGGPRSGWLTLWSAQNELGRPLYHISGFSPAYPFSWLIARFTGNPWRFLTVLSLSTCYLAGLFMLMLSRELRLYPIGATIQKCGNEG